MSVPRAEFRVFGHGIIDLVQKNMWHCSAVLHSARQMPPEIYLLSRHSTKANVKVRDGLLDIKIKIDETPEGYEIFQPTGKFPFPISHAGLNDALSHLKIHIPLPQSTSELQSVTTYTLEGCLTLAQNHPDITTVTVEKLRSRFTVENVMCEYARVYFNGALMETACCESENTVTLRDVVQTLGIAAMPNTNYIVAARRVAGM